MTKWPRYPTLYEINTWVWLGELSRRAGTPVDLGSVSTAEWDAIAALGFDAVWLMGVWKRSPAGIAIANRNPSLLNDFRRTLPDFRLEDNVGSPYCVRDYVVDRHFGGPAGLAAARRELAMRGMKLVLDFVPNHVAPDHPWARDYPEYFIQGSAEDARKAPESYIEVQGTVFACGRDPYFPAWPDVLQLNAFQPALRQAVLKAVSEIARQCDGVRCDMAMLLLSTVFERTWGARAGQPPATEYWSDLIPAVKQAYPDFLFIAEAYWDLEWELQQLGFDFCYDKRLYDRLEHDNAESVRLHLCADLTFQQNLLRFIENHDEPRAAATFSAAKEQAAAVTTSTVPGARLFHEGQLQGRKIKLPVFLGRRPKEPVDPGLQAFYRKLLETIKSPAFHDGQWSLCQRSGWPDNFSFQNVVACCWSNNDDRCLIVVNLSESTIQALVQVPWEDVQGQSCRLVDAISGVVYERSGSEMVSPGLYVELGPWQYNVFQCQVSRAGQHSSVAAAG